jgi:hypothetical protein
MAPYHSYTKREIGEIISGKMGSAILMEVTGEPGLPHAASLLPRE